MDTIKVHTFLHYRTYLHLIVIEFVAVDYW